MEVVYPGLHARSGGTRGEVRLVIFFTTRTPFFRAFPAVQVMPERQALTYRHDVTDVTRVWPHSDFPLIPVGELVLDRNPENYFAEVEQVAFSPGNLVPGIEPSEDKMLQGRLFSYPDTHRHRLGGKCCLKHAIREGGHWTQ